MQTKVEYTCPPDHAFVGKWTNDLQNECKWSYTYKEAIWQYWKAPGLNMTNDTNKYLPKCVRKF